MNDITTVVTGASSGIGTAIARALDRADATVVACAHDGDALQSVINDIERDGGSANAARTGVRGGLDIERLMGAAIRTGEHIDVLVASATVAHETSGKMPAPKDSYATFDDTLRANIRGVFTAIKEALPHMADDGHTLVPSGSVAREAKPRMGVYTVSKAAAEALVRQFVADCSRTVAVVGPGLVATDLTGGQGHDPDGMADLFVRAATNADPTEFDGDIAGLKAWKRAAH